MTKAKLCTVLCLAVAMALAACEDDKNGRIVIDDLSIHYKDLTEFEHVLYNLELAYNNRDITGYRELIDSDEYIFWFAPNEPESQWTREQDDKCAENMFTGKESNDSRYGKIKDIKLKLLFAGATWTDVVEPGFESETWKEVTINYIYDLSIEPDWRIINGDDAKGTFTVRQVMDTKNNRMEWRLVRWRDLGFIQLSATNGGGQPAASGSATQEQTWGQIKALYQ